MNTNQVQNKSPASSATPVTILTGFLGAGKTTLLKYLLSQNHGYKIAIIENEFGAENIDQELIYQHTSENIIQMNNGCICCSIRSDLQQALVQLKTDKINGVYDFDYVIIETTGLAEPSPIAQTFFLDEVIAKAYRLDGVLCLVDAKHTLMHAKNHTEVQKQIGFADRLFISKADLIDEKHLAELKHYLRQINVRAPIELIDHGQINLAAVFALKAFNLNDVLELDRDFLEEEKNHHLLANHNHNHNHHHNHKHEHKHDEHHEHHEHHHEHGCGDDDCTHHHHQHTPTVQSFAYTTTKAFDEKKLEFFIGQILANYSEQLLRYKGVLHIQGKKEKVILQGVHEIVAVNQGKPWTKIKPESKLVFIGLNLPKDVLQKGLDLCLYSA